MSKNNKTTGEKLTKKQVMSIIRDILIKRPDYKKYGFNRSIIDSLKLQFGITMSDANICKYIKDIEKEWQNIKTTVVTKQQIIDMFKDLYEEEENTFAKIKILTEIGKLEKHYIEIYEDLNPKSQVYIYSIPDNSRDAVTPVKAIKKAAKVPQNRLQDAPIATELAKKLKKDE